MEKTCTSYRTCHEKRKTLFQKRGYPILECQKCGHRFVEISDHEKHLSDVYSDDYFFEGKDGYPNYLDEKDLRYKQGLRYARLVSKYANPGKLLDIGCAAGFILKGFEHAGWTCQGIEPNDTMASYGRDFLHLDIKTSAVETFETEERFDLIILIQVIGHVYDLDKALQNVNRLLKPNGIVLVESWNTGSLAARLLGQRWHEYSPPSVVHWYSDKTLGLLFKYYGFQLVDKGYALKKINTKHAFSFLAGKTANTILKKIVESANKFVMKFALIYPLFDVKWYVFKKVAQAGHVNNIDDKNKL